MEKNIGVDDEKVKKLKHKINCTRFALNNDKTELWNKEGIFSGCVFLRYLAVLYWAQINPIFRDESFTIHELNKAAKQLYLNFVKDRRARPIYLDLVKRKEVLLEKKESVDYFSITKKGIKLCNDSLDILWETVSDLKEICKKDVFLLGSTPKPDIPKTILHKISIISRDISD